MGEPCEPSSRANSERRRPYTSTLSKLPPLSSPSSELWDAPMPAIAWDSVSARGPKFATSFQSTLVKLFLASSFASRAGSKTAPRGATTLRIRGYQVTGLRNGKQHGRERRALHHPAADQCSLGS